MVKARVRRGDPKIIMAMLVSLLACLGPAASPASELEVDDFAELDLEEMLEVVFTAAKHQQDIADSPSAITVIGREQIANTHCTDLVCLLRQQPEVDVVQITPMWASLGARALTEVFGDKTLVMIDGREATLEAFGIVLWQALPYHLEDIERVELIRGPGSALYGANAHSLVVSITTRRAARDGAEAYLLAGENGRVSANLRLDKLLGNWKLSLTGGLDYAGHFELPYQRERQAHRLRVQAVRESGPDRTTLQANLLMGQGNIYVVMLPAFLDDAVQVDVQVRHEHDWLTAQLTFQMLETALDLELPLEFQGLQLVRVTEPFGLLTTSLDASLEANWSPFQNNLLVGGTNFRWTTFRSEQNDPDSAGEYRLGLFLQDEHKFFDQLILTAGVRFDYNSVTDYALSPRLAAVWRMHPDHVIRLAAGRAFRKPSFFNTKLHLNNLEETGVLSGIYEFVTENIGDPDLVNESITTLEAGYRGRFLEGALTAELTVFFNMYQDLIYFHQQVGYNSAGWPDLDNTKLKFENSDDEIDTLGGSLSVVYRLAKKLRLSVNYTLRHSRHLSGPDQDQRVAWEPAHLFNLGAHYLQDRGLRAGLAVHATSVRTQLVNQGGEALAARVPVRVPGHLALSGFFSYRWDSNTGWLELGLRAQNLLNHPHRDYAAMRRLRSPTGYVGGQIMSRQVFAFLRASL